MRRRLGKVLHDHILTEMPSVLKDVEAGISERERGLARLGPARASQDDQRRHLLQASAKFPSLISSSNDGIYTDPFFGSGIDDKDFPKRVCAVSTSILDRFRDELT